MPEPERVEYTLHTVEVTYIARPYGPGRVNPPDLWDLRRFVAACDGLPDDLPVAITPGPSDTNGRRDVLFSVRQVEPYAAPGPEPEPEPTAEKSSSLSIPSSFKIWSKDA